MRWAPPPPPPPEPPRAKSKAKARPRSEAGNGAAPKAAAKADAKGKAKPKAKPRAQGPVRGTPHGKNQNQRLVNCSKCGREMTSANVGRHEETCRGTDEANRTCKHCGKIFPVLATRKTHENQVAAGLVHCTRNRASD